MADQTTQQQDDFDVNLNQNVRRTLYYGIICPKFARGEPCRECTKSNELYKMAKQEKEKGKKAELEEDAKALYFKGKVFMNMLNIRDEDKTHPARIYALPPQTYDDLMTQIRGKKEFNPTANVFHPVSGYNILITRSGQGRNTRYQVQIDSDQSEIPNKILLEQLKNGDRSGLHNLDRIEEFIENGYEHITQCEPGVNVLRLLPAHNGQSIYKELRFHRFTADTYKSNRAATQTVEDDSKLAGPSFDSEGKQDEFHPLDLPQTEEEKAPQQEEAKEEIVAEEVAKEVETKETNSIKEMEEKIKQSLDAGMDQEAINNLLEQVKSISSKQQ